MQEGAEPMSEFVVARGQATKLFDPIEESLDEVPRLVSFPVEIARRQPVAARGNYRFGSRRGNRFDERIAVISLVGDLAPGKDQSQRIAQGIYAGVNLGGQAAPRPTDRLIATVFLGAPAACWWARTTVESMNSSS